MASLKKRLTSLFRTKKVAEKPSGSLNADGTPVSPPKGPATIDKRESEQISTSSPSGNSPNQPQQNQDADVSVKTAGGFENAELFLEIKANSEIAKAPWSGKLTSFQTGAWDHKSAEIELLPADAMEDLNEAYVYIRLANRLVWLSEDLGRSSQDIAENYTKMCKNVAERLDKAMSLIAMAEQATEPEKAAVKQADQTRKPEAVVEIAEKRVATALEQPGQLRKPETTGVVEAELGQPPPAAAVETPKQNQAARKTEGRKATTESRIKKTEKRKVAASTGTKARFEEEDKLLFRGINRLLISQGAQGAQITALMNLLSETQEIKVLSSGGAAGQRSWVIVSTENALPLLQILRNVPMVRKVSKQGNEIEVTLAST